MARPLFGRRFLPSREGAGASPGCHRTCGAGRCQEGWATKIRQNPPKTRRATFSRAAPEDGAHSNIFTRTHSRRRAEQLAGPISGALMTGQGGDTPGLAGGDISGSVRGTVTGQSPVAAHSSSHNPAVPTSSWKAEREALHRERALICFTISINYQINEIPAHSLGTLPHLFGL